MGADRHPGGDEHGAQPRGSSNVPASASSRMTRDVTRTGDASGHQGRTGHPLETSVAGRRPGRRRRALSQSVGRGFEPQPPHYQRKRQYWIPHQPRHVRTGIAVGFCPCGALGPPNHARARLQSKGRAAVISAVHHRGRDVIEAQAAVCELRQAHPRWGARRLEFETHQISGQI